MAQLVVRAAVDVFTRALQQASLYTNKDSKGVRMNFDDGSLTLTSRVPEEGEAEIARWARGEG